MVWISRQRSQLAPARFLPAPPEVMADVIEAGGWVPAGFSTCYAFHLSLFAERTGKKIIFLTRILGWKGFSWPSTEDLVIMVLLSHRGPCSKYEVCWLPLPPSFTYPVHCSSSPCRAPPQPPLEHLHGRSITKFSPKPDLH